MISSNNFSMSILLLFIVFLSDFIVKISNVESGLVFVVLFCFCVSLWLIYIIFYYSRVMGFIFIKLINFKYIKDG